VNPQPAHGRITIVRPLHLGTLALVVGLAVGLLAPFPGSAQPPAVKVPDPFTFPQGKDSPGVVTFDHAKHREAGNDKCTACHTKVFKMKKGTSGTVTMTKMKAGEFCGACHNGKTQVGTKVVFTTEDKSNCERCHRK
jgi:c(7)-type cytochrome triheme protein